MIDENVSWPDNLEDAKGGITNSEGNTRSIYDMGANISIQENEEDDIQDSEAMTSLGIDMWVEGFRAKGLPAYNGYKLKKEYPNAWNKLLEYCKIQAEGADNVDDETVIGILLYSPRIVLFDFFDREKIYVNTIAPEMGNQWTNTLKSQMSYNTRTLAEVDAFEYAFLLLEEKLTTKP